MKIMSKIAGIAILLLGMATHASAVTIFATTGLGAGLGTIDSTTGTGTPLVTFSAGSNQGIAFTPDGTLWTIERTTGQVATVDIATGTVTTVGAASGIVSVADLASDAAGNLYGTDGTNLYSIDKATGAVNLIGAFGTGSVYGIAFYNGVLYAMSWTNVHTVDPATGAILTTVPLSAAPATGGYGGLGIDPNSGTAYFINYWTPPDTLNSVDLATGQITLIGTTGLGNTFSLDFMPVTPAALIKSGGCILDAETGFGPLLLTLVLLALAFLYRRRTGI